MKRTIVAMMMAVMIAIPTSAQTQEVPDTIVMTRAQFTQLQNDIRELLIADSLNVELIRAQEYEILSLRGVLREDSVVIRLKDRRIQMLESLNTLYEDKIDTAIRTPPWYDGRGFWMSMGGVVVIVSSWLFGG